MMYSTVTAPRRVFATVDAPRRVYTAVTAPPARTLATGQLYDDTTGALLYDSITGAPLTW